MCDDATFLAQLALQALRDSRRDADWCASALLDYAIARVIDDDFGTAMEIANKAIMVRDAIDQRIAIFAADIDRLAGLRAQAERAGEAKPLH
jgi:hypothetical protein